MWQQDFNTAIKQEFIRRKAQDFDFSMRKFAKLAGVSSSTMSDLLKDHVHWKVTEDRALEIIDRIGLPSFEKNRLLLRIGRDPELEKSSAQEDYIQFLVSGKHRIVLMSLDLGLNFKEKESVCQRFGISDSEYEDILRLGLEIGIMKSTPQGIVSNETKFWSTVDNVPNTMVREYQRQCILRAAQSLEQVPVTKRDCTSMTFVASSKKMEVARKELRTCYDRIITLMNEPDDNDEVYQLSISLIPLSQEQESK